ncbi:MAG: hypothetical protein KF781_02805 [Chitinophagaceae bacterium]|nr:hypothetical protein [Chitinophagaceae bacterium]MCW5904440.1 hypothetical protein [Chitinophagaceae bacterium]
MKKYIVGFWFSMPIQLFILHFRKYQIFLVFWYILFATVGGTFLNNFGAYSLYLAPEYYNEVNFFSTSIVGFAIGIFIMSWNITTFILFRKYIHFLATTAQPFLKYCINNGIIPVLFLLYYFFTAVQYNHQRELKSFVEIAILSSGFLFGFLLSVTIAFVYFFSADKRIFKNIGSTIVAANKRYNISNKKLLPEERKDLRIDWFFSARMHLRKPRDVRHYSESFLDSIFKQHHIASIIAFFIAFIVLIGLGFSSDMRLFQIPAAASITIFFALLVAVGGAFSLFLKTWSIPVLILVYIFFNFLYQKNVIDPRNKAYGINYENKKERPDYNKDAIYALASKENIDKDKAAFLQRLEAWKSNQVEEKPILYLINTSGGGIRSANFTFSILQKLDAVIFNDSLMQKAFFINGASGGLLGAAYYRELYLRKLTNNTINLQSKQYVNDISKDLLNPIFSSFVSRDIIGPVQRFQQSGFRYIKDRGYAFERKLNVNTHGYLNKPIADYTDAENKAIIPTMFFNSTISSDGRKMVICTQPVRFLMGSSTENNSASSPMPDIIDFNSFFVKQNSTQIGMLSALRMNATFPYVLPNVWLPTNPVIDVMDAGLRDNFGQENTLRFIESFKEWLQANTSKIVIIQIRDRNIKDWDTIESNKSLISIFTKPAFLLQYNWFRLQDYYQDAQLDYLNESYGNNIDVIRFQYVPSAKNKAASLSFHLTAAEKKEIALALNNEINIEELNKLKKK